MTEEKEELNNFDKIEKNSYFAELFKGLKTV